MYGLEQNLKVDLIRPNRLIQSQKGWVSLIMRIMGPINHKPLYMKWVMNEDQNLLDSTHAHP